ncbi:MAG: MFS transporter, partial [Candidatus Bathyarchaeia archaeon]
MKATKIHRLYQKAYLELLVSSFTLVMSMGSISAFLPILSHELDPSGILVGLVVSVWFLSRIFTEIPSGILADNIGRYKLLVTGLVLSTLGAFLCSFANAILILIVGRAIW